MSVFTLRVIKAVYGHISLTFTALPLTALRPRRYRTL